MDASNAYLRATYAEREETVGQSIFEVDQAANGSPSQSLGAFWRNRKWDALNQPLTTANTAMERCGGSGITDLHKSNWKENKVNLARLVVGLFADFLASKFVNKTGSGLPRDIVLGISVPWRAASASIS